MFGVLFIVTSVYIENIMWTFPEPTEPPAFSYPVNRYTPTANANETPDSKRQRNPRQERPTKPANDWCAKWDDPCLFPSWFYPGRNSERNPTRASKGCPLDFQRFSSEMSRSMLVALFIFNDWCAKWDDTVTPRQQTPTKPPTGKANETLGSLLWAPLCPL